MQIETAHCFLSAKPDTAKLFADARLGIFCQRNVATENVQDRRFAPVEGVAEIQVKRPVVTHRWASFDIDYGPTLGVAMNTGRKPVGAAAFDGSKNGDGADDMVATAVEREPSPVHESIHVAIGLDPEHQNPPIHAADAFVDGREPPRNVALNRGSYGRQSKFNRCGDP